MSSSTTNDRQTEPTSSPFRRTLVTSALPYANGYIHLGHLAGVYLPADIYTRFLRLSGEDVIHISGSDENGVPITLSADAEGVTPQEIAEKYHTANEAALRGAGIDFDYFGRTTDPEHHKTAQEFFLALWEGGFFVEKEEQQFYDPVAEKFLPDRYVEGTCPVCGFESARGDQCDNCSSTYNQIELTNPTSKLSGGTPELRTTRHAYLKLGDFQSRLEAFVEAHRDDWRGHAVQQARSWLKEGLTDRAMTRDLDWGIDVPIDGYEGKKLYVWFDAPFGYITNTRRWAEEQGSPEEWKRWWQQSDSRYVAFLGKDNIVFHTIIFPATLIGYNDGVDEGENRYILPDNVSACEFLNLEGRKFSKSNNWGIDLRDYLDRHPVDLLRYTLAANLPENKDGDFTWREWQARANNELADILGNFVNRTLTFAHRYFDGVVPALTGSESENEERQTLSQLLVHFSENRADRADIVAQIRHHFINHFNETDLEMLYHLADAPGRIEEAYRSFRFRDATLETMNLARAANKYFNDSEPWKTRKEDLERCGVTINICLQTIRALAVLFAPIVPETSRKMLLSLGLDPALIEGRDERLWWESVSFDLQGGDEIGEPAILFEKIDDAIVESEVVRLGSGGDVVDQEGRAVRVDLKPEITIDDVMKLDLRSATILEAEKVKKSSKLLQLQVRVGDQQRTIVAGIAKGYDPDDLVGKKIVVVANLKPATLMGIESQGMLLAANDPDDPKNPPILVSFVDEGPPDGYEVR